MGHATVLVNPVSALFAAVEFCVLQHGFSVLLADGIGDLPQAVVVRNMVFKLPAGAERYGVHDDVIVDVICVQVGGDYNLVIVAPHPPCGFHADGVRFFRCYFTGLEALVAMVGNIASQLPIAALGVHHGFVGKLLGAVDGADIHFLIGLFIVGGITQGAVQILVQVLAVGSFIRVLRIVDGIL